MAQRTLTIVSANGKPFNKVLNIASPCAVILYGYGADLGDFKVYADSLKENELKAKYGQDIIIERIYGKTSFFNFFINFDLTKYKISELHIFAHSFGAGLSFPYHEYDDATGTSTNPEVQEQINKLRTYNKTTYTYDEVVDIEPNLLTDHFLTLLSFVLLPLSINLFNINGFIKIWGCNSGIENWIYGSSETIDYYWRALNDKNTPKPSIAQAIADFFRVKTYGATSGSHSEVLVNGKWITSQEYKNIHKKWPSTKLPHRLHPDKGNYIEFNPR
ncbi:MAG: hypothetical protein ACK5IC_10880 [Moheibacter sp.]